MRYLLMRLAETMLLVAAVAIVSFVVLELAPGDFLDELKLNPRISAATVAALRDQYGLAGSAADRFGHWIASVAHGDFGYSLAYRSPVAPLVVHRAANTLLLTVPAVLLTWLLALPIGLWAVCHRGRWVDRASDAITSVLVSMPELLLALLVLLIALRTGWFSTSGYVLPLGALVAALFPLVLRHVRASVGEVMNAPALRAARGHGIPRTRLLWRYALPLAANPLVSLAGFSIGALLSMSLLVEVVMGWPGLGPLLLEAILARDLHVVLGATLLSTMVLATATLIADVALFMADPRIRASHDAS
jgi:peptide/nickel transport system permease protein